MLTTRSVKFIALFIGCLIIGLILGNQIILAMSLAPLSLIILGVITETPGQLNIRTRKLVSQAWVGDVAQIKYEITVSSGLGIISFFQALPPHFALVEGNNLRVFWKGWHNQTLNFTYKIRCTKRGNYTLPAIQWEANHALRLTQTRGGSLGEPVTLTVRPKILNVRRIRGLPGIATSPFPVIDIAKIGVATTDFREIRHYVYGDPIKNINWKATARNTSPQPWPLTNEYEVEGKKAVWLFLDACRALEVGTDIENVFEYCLEATNGVVYYFLDRGYRVGMYIYNDGEKLFYPDAGKKQFLKISRELIDLKAGSKCDEFPTAIEKCRRYILGYNPLCVVVTRLDSRYSDNVIMGMKKLYQLRGRQRHKLPAMVINVAGYNIVSNNDGYENNTTVLMQLNARPRVQQLRRLGTSVLDWNPRKESFGTALLKQVKTR